MVGLRISGIVRCARWAKETLREGLPAGERDAFLTRVSSSVARIEDICAARGLSPDVLPAPSRRALADLRRIAQLGEGELRGPAPDAPERRRLKISNVVRTRDRVLARLERAPPESDALQRAVQEARHSADRVEAILHQEGVGPAALPRPTGMAYAFLAWLREDGHAEHYVAQRDRTLSYLIPALTAAGLLHDSQGHGCRWTVAVRFQPGRRIFARAAQAGHVLRCTLNAGWLAADDGDLRALALVAADAKKAPPAAHERADAFLASEDYAALCQELRGFYVGDPDNAQGRVHDLDELFDGLNEQFFHGAMSRPRLTWHTSTAQRRFGFYAMAQDRVCIDDRLDEPEVPARVVEFVLYHELLHRKHGVERHGRRRHAHTAAFRADERRHPAMAEAEAWMSALLSHHAVPRKEPDPPPRMPAQPPRTPPPASPPPATSRGPAVRGGSPVVSGAGPRWMPRQDPPEVLRSEKIPRNAPCPCGSGRKYKRCCA